MEEEKKETNKVDITYKDRMFRLIFKKKEELLSLYNAVNDTHYTDPDELEINTLENAIYMKMKNDLSFLIDSRLSLYEHQSTYNPNMPLRSLFYISDLFKKRTADKNIYGKKIIPLPLPNFVVFYNGVEKHDEREIFSLSDAYEIKLPERQEYDLELKVVSLNINPGYNEELKLHCKTLRDYMIYVEKVRKYRKKMSLEDAVDKAIEECIQEGVLVEFLKENRAEARNVSIYEYNEEEHIRMEREEAREEERVNTRREAERADKEAERAKKESDRADKAEEELKRLCELLDKQNK